MTYLMSYVLTDTTKAAKGTLLGLTLLLTACTGHVRVERNCYYGETSKDEAVSQQAPIHKIRDKDTPEESSIR